MERLVIGVRRVEDRTAARLPSGRCRLVRLDEAQCILYDARGATHTVRQMHSMGQAGQPACRGPEAWRVRTGLRRPAMSGCLRLQSIPVRVLANS